MNQKTPKPKSSVRYKILIKYNNLFYKVGTIVVRTYTGDLMYVPSDTYIESPITLEKIEIEHIVWHLSGRVHIKRKNQKDIYNIIQKNGERQKLSEIGFQNMISDIIKDFKKLPIYQKKVVPLDVVFELDKNYGQVSFIFSILSGKLIVAQFKGIKTPITQINIKDDNSSLAVKQRALGCHSGNADVILQYVLKKSKDSNVRTNRRIFIPHDMKISKVKFEKMLK